jgi:hypothetical protein
MRMTSGTEAESEVLRDNAKAAAGGDGSGFRGRSRSCEGCRVSIGRSGQASCCDRPHVHFSFRAHGDDCDPRSCMCTPGT